MKSKKKLFAALDTYYGTTTFTRDGLKHCNISDETYGRMSCIYITEPDRETLLHLQAVLIRDGFKCNEAYARSNPVIEVRVSYFKGYHWDE